LTARRPDAQTLLIVSDPTSLGIPMPADTWREAAARHFAGRIVVGEDLMEL